MQDRLTRRGALMLPLLLAAGGVAAAPAPLADANLRGDPPPEPAPIAGKGFRCVRNWDFGLTVTDPATLRHEFASRFVYEGGTLDHLPANGEWQRYREGNYELGGGMLRLVARLEGKLAPGNVSSGLLRSRWTGKYGYFEARFRSPRGRGLWPAFWLNPEDGRWPPEIDIVEIVDNGRDTTKQSFHNVRGGRDGDAVDVSGKLDRWGAFRPGGDYADGFHSFAALWTEDDIRHYVDGAEVAHRRYAWRHADGTDAGPAHVLLNLAVGGTWPGPPESPGEFPAVMEVEFVRVWQR